MNLETGKSLTRPAINIIPKYTQNGNWSRVLRYNAPITEVTPRASPALKHILLLKAAGLVFFSIASDDVIRSMQLTELLTNVAGILRSTLRTDS